MTAQARLLGGRYQVGELLGYGGMAEVHLGRDLRLGRDVAIKTLRTDLARDDTFQLRFRREAQNSASLNHPAVVAVYDTGDEPGPAGETVPYIVMEFVNGRTLKEVLAAEGRLMPRRAMEITADVCSALEFSHRAGIIHRDIKPGNVMLTQTGQVKVMDFGIARALASGASTMTQTSAVIGTAQYLSPEQARGEAVDARSDVYATGCLLYELVCGHPPFVGDNPVSVAYQHVREDPRPPSDSNRDVTPDVDAITLKALAKNPINRYQSAGEMRADLLRAAAGRPVMATPVMRETERTSMIPPGGGRGAGPGTRPVARVAPPPRRRSSTGLVVALTLLGLLAVVALSAGLWLASRTKLVAVPDLRGKTQAAAETAIKDGKLTPKGKTAQGNCTKGQVIEQSPAAGDQVAEGQTVEYTVCLGPNAVTVPPLLNLKKDQAQKALTDKGLKFELVSVDSSVDQDVVIGSDPIEGTAVDAGATVKVKISNHKLRKVPDLVGKARVQAEAALAQAGFTNVRFVDQASSADQNGKVINQSLDAGLEVAPATQITIFVGQSGSPSPSPSPSVSKTP